MESFLSERIKLPELQKNVWTEFAQLARQHNCKITTFLIGIVLILYQCFELKR